MTCSNCGEVNPPEARFCRNCGSALVARVEASAASAERPKQKRFIGRRGLIGLAGLAALMILAGIIGLQARFVVDEGQLAIVTRFGDPISSITKPGQYTKTPFIDRVIYVNEVLVFDVPAESLLTRDKKRVIIVVSGRGRIVEVVRFIETLRSESRATSRAIDIIASELRRETALYKKSEIIETGGELIMNNVKDRIRPHLREFGIEITDLSIETME